VKKIGLFGGTFNPIHYGHLRTALEIYEDFALDKVLFVPSYIPPHKIKGDIAAPEVRLEMTRIAVEDFKVFEVCDMEIIRKDVSYSLDTVKILKSTSKDTKIFFILGTDAFYELSTWKKYDEFIFLCDFVVMKRPGTPIKDLESIFPPKVFNRFAYDKASNLYKSDAGTGIFFHEITQLDISSTRIRRLCKEKKSIKYLVSENVERYILKNGLYT
jgi:nicotinate-nucleotide adenylyltransferase